MAYIATWWPGSPGVVIKVLTGRGILASRLTTCTPTPPQHVVLFGVEWLAPHRFLHLSSASTVCWTALLVAGCCWAYWFFSLLHLQTPLLLSINHFSPLYANAIHCNQSLPTDTAVPLLPSTLRGNAPLSPGHVCHRPSAAAHKSRHHSKHMQLAPHRSTAEAQTLCVDPWAHSRLFSSSLSTHPRRLVSLSHPRATSHQPACTKAGTVLIRHTALLPQIE